MPLPTTLDKQSQQSFFIIIIIIDNNRYDEVSLKWISALSLKLVLWITLLISKDPKKRLLLVNTSSFTVRLSAV